MRVAATLAALIVLSACGGDGGLAAPSISSVIITAPKQTIAVGEPVQLTATARDVNGLTIGGAKITYARTPTTVLSVNSTGRVIGLTAGSGSVTATSAGITSAPFPFTVTAGSIGAVVTIQANTFTPSLLTIKVGQSILFDFPADQHNVVFAARTGKPADIPTTSAQSVTRAFTTAGTFPFDCTLHPGMSGSVVVTP
jgi:plastocyanin